MGIINISKYSERELLQEIESRLPSIFSIRRQDKSNCYIYNLATFYDITDQQIKNDYNLSTGCIKIKTLSTDKTLCDDGVNVVYSTLSKKTFEIHVWSVNKNNDEVQRIAELVRMACRNLDNMLSVSSDMYIEYAKLDNTTQPMTDCIFSVVLQCQDRWKEEGDVFNSAYIKDIVGIKK